VSKHLSEPEEGSLVILTGDIVDHPAAAEAIAQLSELCKANVQHLLAWKSSSRRTGASFAPEINSPKDDSKQCLHAPVAAEPGAWSSIPLPQRAGNLARSALMARAASVTS
jgi:hypothetical protein